MIKKFFGFFFSVCFWMCAGYGRTYGFGGRAEKGELVTFVIGFLVWYSIISSWAGRRGGWGGGTLGGKGKMAPRVGEGVSDETFLRVEKLKILQYVHSARRRFLVWQQTGLSYTGSTVSGGRFCAIISPRFGLSVSTSELAINSGFVVENSGLSNSVLLEN